MPQTYVSPKVAIEISTEFLPANVVYDLQQMRAFMRASTYDLTEGGKPGCLFTCG